MGKINEYQRQKLASAAVGTTQPSKAGQIIGQAVANFGTVIRGREKERARQNDVFSDLRANNHLMDYVSGIHKVIQGLQAEYAANPGQLPAKLQEEGTKLFEEFFGNIKDDQVKSKFAPSAVAVLKRETLRAFDWSVDKQEENALIDVSEGVNKGIMAGGTVDIEGLESSYNMIHETLRNIPSQGDEKPVEIPGLSPDKINEIEKEGRERALRAHLASRVETEPFQLRAALEQGEYDNLSVNIEKRVGDKTKTISVKVPMTAELKREFKKKAFKAESVQQYKKNSAKLARLTGNLFDWAAAMNDGSASLGDLEMEVDRAKHDPATSPEYRAGLVAIYSAQMSKLAHTVTQDDTRMTNELYRKHAELDLEIANARKYQREGDIKTAQRKYADMTTDLIRLYTEVHEKHAEGLITRATKDQFIDEIQSAMYQGILAQEDYSKKSWFQGGGYRDTYGHYYEAMNEQINDISNLSDDDKANAIIKASRFFVEEVMKARAQSPNQEVTAAQRTKAVKDAMDFVRQLYDPTYALYSVGEVTPDGKVVGYSERGAPLFEMPDSAVNAIKEGIN